MFEMFGDRDNMEAIYSSQLKKLVLMAEHVYEPTDNDRSVIRNSLKEILNRFYIDARMWAENSGQNKEHIRAVGIPHDQVPTLHHFVAYLKQQYKALVQAQARDDEVLHAFSILSGAFNDLLISCGDLFNNITRDSLDEASVKPRVIYDFSNLRAGRSRYIEMAQFINVLTYAVNLLQKGDLVLIHGAERIEDTVKEYLQEQFDLLYDRGVRIGYLYNRIEAMLKSKSFSEFEKADYTILGGMTDVGVAEYQKMLGQEMPADLVSSIVTKDETIYYIRRNFDNVVFSCDLSLGLPKGVRRRL